ncbi:MAG: hypothetical protein ABII80_00195 [bacterium]
MPALNKQTLINLLIDSPLREPIKINLIDIVNNTNDADLPKVYPTITKELEIFEKASERRLKLSAETIAKLQGKSEEKPVASTPTPPPAEKPPSPLSAAEEPPTPPVETPPAETPPSTPPLSVPPLDLPPFPTKPTDELPPAPPTETPPEPEKTPNPLADAASVTPTSSADADEEALKEIQKELDNLKVSATEESAPPAPPTTAAPEPTPPETPSQA